MKKKWPRLQLRVICGVIREGATPNRAQYICTLFSGEIWGDSGSALDFYNYELLSKYWNCVCLFIFKFFKNHLQNLLLYLLFTGPVFGVPRI